MPLSALPSRVPEALLDELARRFDFAPARLGPWVRALSEAYVHGAPVGRAGLCQAHRLAAYGRYFLPAGYLKLHLPLAELARLGPSDPTRPARVRLLDLGAGLGTYTLSLLGYLAARRPGAGRVEVVAVDLDRAALDAGAALCSWWARRALPQASFSLDAVAGGLFDPLPGRLGREPFDLIVAGHVLCEWGQGDPDPRKTARNLTALAARLGEDGALVVIEPALKRTSRALLAVRDAIVDAAGGLSVFAPCLHAAPCPALARERDWCHERLAWELPPAVQAICRSAGLQKNALAFSYLTLRRAGPTLREVLGEAPADGLAAARVVSDALREKGKRGCIGCTEAGRRVYYEALDRRGSEAAAALKRLRRGDLLWLGPGREVGGRARLDAETPPRPVAAARECLRESGK